MFGVKCLIPDQCQNPSWGPNHDVRTVVLQCLLVLLDGNTTKEDRNLNVVEVLAKALILLVYLKSQLSIGGGEVVPSLEVRNLQNEIELEK